MKTLIYGLPIQVPDDTDPASVTYELRRALEDSALEGHGWIHIYDWHAGQAVLLPS